MFAAKWDDFDAEGGRLRIDEAAVDSQIQDTKTPGSRAWVWLPKSNTQELLEVLCAAPPPAGGRACRHKQQRTSAISFQKVGTAKDIQALLRHTTPVATLGMSVEEAPESVRTALGQKLRVRGSTTR